MPTRTQARHWKSLDLDDSSSMDVVHSSDPFPDVRPSSFSISLPDNSIQPVIEVIAHNSAVYTADQTMEDFAEELVRSALLDARMGAAGDQQIYGNPSGLRVLEDRERYAGKYYAAVNGKGLQRI